MKVAVVGATGLVGQVMLKVLEEQAFPLQDLIPVASEASKGKEVIFREKAYKVVTAEEALGMNPGLALFSAGAQASALLAPGFARAGCTVIDNSSQWRMDPSVPLVVPEVNPHRLHEGSRIIANPNCSTIQLVVALFPLHQRYGIRRVVVSTYQSVTGTGVKAVHQLRAERAGLEAPRAYPHPIDLNIFPHGGSFLPNGYTTEEEKLVNESRKIMEIPELALTATVVRVPVFGGHSEAVNIEFEKDFELEDVRDLLAASPGISLIDEPSQNLYPMPLTAEGRDEVFVGRLRRDESRQASLNLWIVSDNLRKGAATNAVQIASYLNQHHLL